MRRISPNPACNYSVRLKAGSDRPDTVETLWTHELGRFREEVQGNNKDEDRRTKRFTVSSLANCEVDPICTPCPCTNNSYPLRCHGTPRRRLLGMVIPPASAPHRARPRFRVDGSEAQPSKILAPRPTRRDIGLKERCWLALQTAAESDAARHNQGSRRQASLVREQMLASRIACLAE